MNRPLLLAAVALAAVIAAPATSRAGQVELSITYRSGHARCGCPLYTRRVVRGYDRHRRPLYHYIGVPVRHHCRPHARWARPRYYDYYRSGCGPAAWPPAWGVRERGGHPGRGRGHHKRGHDRCR